MHLDSLVSRTLVLSALVLGACAPTAFPTADQMMGGASTSEAMTEKTPTADAMTMQETLAAGAMETALEPPMQMAVWLGTPLADAVTGRGFQVADHHGKVVLVETMAVWCTNCRAQQEQMRGLQSRMMEQTTDLVLVSLDIDPNEDMEILKKYVNATGFAWPFAVAPPDLIRTIGLTYGDQFLNPPSTPVLIIDRKGVAHTLPFGIKSADDLMQAVQPYLDASG
jgi:cytochrome oxidase Cu insertion factor (SCO1/SenC/PrrC family)